MEMHDGLKGIPSEDEIYLKKNRIIDYGECNNNARLSQHNRWLPEGKQEATKHTASLDSCVMYRVLKVTNSRQMGTPGRSRKIFVLRLIVIT